MLRAIGLSLLMLFAVAVTLPVVESHAGRNSKASWQKRYKKMTRRQRQAYMRRRRAAVRRRQMLARLRQQEALKANSNGVSTAAQFVQANAIRPAVLAGAPQIATPAGWRGGAVANGEMRWQVLLANTAGTGNVTFAPLGTAGEDNNSPNNRRFRTLGGRAHSDLRKQVIDRMITEGGWVTNDAELNIGGHPTFVVYAASGNQSDPRQWAFYYTVVDNRLYRFVFDAPGDNAKRIAGDVESLVASLRPSSPSSLTARSQ